MDAFLTLDNQSTYWLYDWGSRYPVIQQLFLYVAVVAVYALPVMLLWLFWRNRGHDRRVSVKIFLAAIVVWKGLSSWIGDWLYGAYAFRDRPFLDRGFQEFFFERPEKAFPSDHAAVLTVVTALLLAYGYRRLGGWFVAALLLTALGRVVVGFHFVGDVLGGIALGLVMYGLMRLLDRPLERLFDRIGFLRVREGDEA